MKLTALLTALIAALFIHAPHAEAHSMKDTPLNPQQQAMVTISAFSANGDLEKLKTALADGLEAGLTVNQIKEILVQVYAYAGFPRSLNAITTFQTLLEERQAKGIRDKEGPDASPLPTDRSSLDFGTENQTRLIGSPVGGGIYAFVPAIDQFLKAHLFGDIFQRDTLDWLSREIVTIAILASIEGLNPQLQGHYRIAMHNGFTLEQGKAFADLLGARVGKNVSDNAAAVFLQAAQQ